MEMADALGIINKNSGYMVSFEKKVGSFLTGDYFPDKHAGEELIKTKTEAWILARKFAKNTVGECVNIYVIDFEFSPVKNYKTHFIENRREK